MWSVKSRIVSQHTDENPSRCKICKKESIKIRIKEKKVTRILLVIPVLKTNEYFEVCSGCRARIRYAPDDTLLDANM